MWDNGLMDDAVTKISITDLCFNLPKSNAPFHYVSKDSKSSYHRITAIYKVLNKLQVYLELTKLVNLLNI